MQFLSVGGNFMFKLHDLYLMSKLPVHANPHCAIQIINCSSICHNGQVFSMCLSCEILDVDRYSFLLIGLFYTFYYFSSNFKESFNTSIVVYIIEVS